LYNTVIYPTAPQNKVEEAEKLMLKMIKDYKIDLIVI
jgi:transcriptional accessory protein Tex/SPT6